MSDLEWVRRDGVGRWEAEAGGGGSTPDLAAVLAEGGDPDGNPITGPVSIESTDAVNPPLEVKSSHSDLRLARFKRSDDTNILVVNSAGLVDGDGNQATMFVDAVGVDINLDPHGDGTHGFFGVGPTSNTNFIVNADGQVGIQPPAGSTADPLGVRLEGGSFAFLVSADGTIWLGPSGAYMSPGGSLVMEQHSAPADGELGAGECALWFDQTNGAAKLMVKAKTADGTVVTGNVPLT